MWDLRKARNCNQPKPISLHKHRIHRAKKITNGLDICSTMIKGMVFRNYSLGPKTKQLGGNTSNTWEDIIVFFLFKILQKTMFVPSLEKINQTLRPLERSYTHIYVVLKRFQKKNAQNWFWGLGSELISLSHVWILP